jgi:hypothetical protein
MYKTAIAHIEAKTSYREALNIFRQEYPEYKVRGIKQSSNGWLAFIQKEAYQNQNVQDGIPAEEMAMDEMGMDEVPAPEDLELPSPGADEEPDTEYESEEGKQDGLMGQLQDALDKVEQLVSELKESEETEDEVRPDFGPEDEEDEEDEGSFDLEREKENGLTLASATAEVEELLSSDPSFRGYRIASVSETKTSFIAKLKK